MKKKICFVLTIALVAVAIMGYIKVNREFPRAKEIMTPVGECAEYQEEVFLSVLEKRIWTAQETEQFFEKYDEEITNPVKMLEVTMELENISKQEKQITLHELNLEMVGFHSVIINMEVLSSDTDDKLVQNLQPQEKRRIRALYQIVLYPFAKTDWDKLVEKDMWLTYRLYPNKRMLSLQ